jgi:hypothetical protein
MGKHHHKPHEGHSDGTHTQHSAKEPVKHNWFFYLAGLAILIALVVYLLSGDLAFTPRVVAPAANAGK